MRDYLKTLFHRLGSRGLAVASTSEPQSFYSASMDEVIGIYTPGLKPVVKENKSVPPDSTLMHEKAHREIFETTSLGLYMLSLTLVAGEANSIIQEKAKQRISALFEMCWLVHEGHATARQYSYLKEHHGLNSATIMLESLPRAYLLAYENFLLDVDAVAGLIGEVQIDSGLVVSFHDMPEEDQLALLEHHHQRGTYLIARAAMSIPLSEILAEVDDPLAQRVLTFMRRCPPDVRLKELNRLMTPDRILLYGNIMIQAQALALREGTPRPMDETLEQLTEQLCKDAGISYEKSDAYDYGLVGRHFGLNIRIADGREVSLKAASDRDHASKLSVDQSNETPHFDLGRAEAFWNYTTDFFSVVPDVVCEISYTKDEYVVLYLSAYVTVEKFLELYLDTKSYKSRGYSSASLMFFGLYLDRRILEQSESLDLLMRAFKHNSWRWVVLFEAIDKYPQIAEYGAVVAVRARNLGADSDELESIARVGGTIPIQSEPPTEGLGWTGEVPAEAVIKTFSSASLPDAVKLASVETTYAPDLQSIDVARYDDSIVGQSLIRGTVNRVQIT